MTFDKSLLCKNTFSCVSVMFLENAVCVMCHVLKLFCVCVKTPTGEGIRICSVDKT